MRKTGPISIPVCRTWSLARSRVLHYSLVVKCFEVRHCFFFSSFLIIFTPRRQKEVLEYFFFAVVVVVELPQRIFESQRVAHVGF